MVLEVQLGGQMNEVRVFDPQGKLKRTISRTELIALSDEQFQKKGRGGVCSDLYRRRKKLKKEEV